MLRPLLLAAVFLSIGQAQAREIIVGPVSAVVERVIDGDTLIVRAAVWPGHTVRVSVRLRGIDAPEMKARCAAERRAARRARDGLVGLVGAAAVTITAVSGDKYFGRVLAQVTTADGLSLADALLAQGLVRPYHGGRRAAYCG